jgi:hypothetical protein
MGYTEETVEMRNKVVGIDLKKIFRWNAVFAHQQGLHMGEKSEFVPYTRK